MTQVNNWFNNVKTIATSSNRVRNAYIMILGLAFFMYRDYQNTNEKANLIQAWIKKSESESKRADRAEDKYDKLLDKTIFKVDKDNDFQDTITAYMKRLEAKIPKK